MQRETEPLATEPVLTEFLSRMIRISDDYKTFNHSDMNVVLLQQSKTYLLPCMVRCRGGILPFLCVWLIIFP